MVADAGIRDLVKKAREGAKKRKFAQAVELILTFKGIDTKKNPLSFSDAIQIPGGLGTTPKICLFGEGDLALRAKRAGVERVVGVEELDGLATQKRAAKKLAKDYVFFLADTSLMQKIGKALGQSLGPRGKMPAPIPPNAPVEAIVQRFRSSTRVRSRGQLAVACRIGSESMKDEDLVSNASAVISSVVKKLPSGEANISRLGVKFTMGALAKTPLLEARR